MSRKLLTLSAFSAVLLSCGDGRLSPQGGTITAINTPVAGGLEGGGMGGALTVKMRDDCTGSQVLAWSGTAWECATPTGDIESVTAGNGLTGGGTTGALTLDVACGTGITCNVNDITIDPTYTQRRVSGTCAAGSSIREIAEAGTVTCETDDGGTSYTGGAGLTLTGADFAVNAGIGLTIFSDTVRLDMVATDCSAGSFLDSVTATGSFGCVAEVGDISNVSVSGPISGGGASGSVSIGLTVCAADQIYKMVGGVWTCSADAGGTSYTAGDGLTLTANDFDLNFTADFVITADQIELSSVVTMPGTLTVTGATTLSSTLGVTGATTLSSTLGVTGATTLSSTLAVNGSATIGDSTADSHFIYGQTYFPGAGGGDTIINYAGGASSHYRVSQVSGVVYLGDSNTGGVVIGLTGNATSVLGALSVAGNTTMGDAATDNINAIGTFGVSGTDVTISSCAGGSVSGEAQSFQLDVGNTATACVVALNRTFAVAPYCTFSPADGRASADVASTGGAGDAPYITSTTTTVTLNASVAFSGALYNVTCLSRY